MAHTFVKKTTKAKSRNAIGKRVREARLRAEPAISQEDLAGRLAAQGITLDRSAISRIEGSERYVMDFEAKALADALKVSVAWLFGV
jgi:ribosome-binding protein aMBF1 (putative translation factor)